MYKRAKQVLLWWDTGCAVTGAVLFYCLIDETVEATFIKDLLGVGISVLSIVFSLFFAALTFIISSSNNEFVRFLVDRNHFDGILWSFRWTLCSLFVSLAYSLILYVYVSYLGKGASSVLAHWLATGFVFLFVYSLVASAFSTNDAIKYARRRARFISLQGDKSRPGTDD